MVKSKNRKFLFFAGSIAVTLLLYYIINLYLDEDFDIKNLLVDIHFYFLEINFLLLCVGLISLYGLIKNLLKKFSKIEKLLLLLIPIAALVLTSMVALKTTSCSSGPVCLDS